MLRTAAAIAVVALFATPVAAAELADEQALAERFAPVVRLVDQQEDDACAYAALALLAGPLIGAILIFTTNAPSPCSTWSQPSCTHLPCPSSHS
jgi:hypothetical protein